MPEDRAKLELGSTDFLPSYEFYEIHGPRVIAAQPAQIIEAAASLDMRSDKVADVLMTIRETPERLKTKLFGAPGHHRKEEFSFDTFTPLRRDDYELSMGLIGRFWKPSLDICDIANATEFRNHSAPTEAKLVLRFCVIEGEENASELYTETFIHCPTRRTKILFLPYWIAIRIFSGWLRKRSLALIQTMATTAEESTPGLL